MSTFGRSKWLSKLVFSKWMHDIKSLISKGSIQNARQTNEFQYNRRRKVHCCASRFHVAATFQETFVKFWCNIQKECLKRLLKYSTLFKLYIFQKLDFLHMLHLKQYIEINWMQNQRDSAFIWESSLSFVNLDLNNICKIYKTMLHLSLPVWENTVVFHLKSISNLWCAYGYFKMN